MTTALTPMTERDPARFDRADRWSFGVTTLLTLGIYLVTLAPEVTLEWSGILSTSANYAGVGPPPGYPAWVLYSWLVIHLLPFSNVAWRVAVGSAIAGALACGIVALIVSRGGRMLFDGTPAFTRLKPVEQNRLRGIAGYAAGLVLGFSHELWGSTVVADTRSFGLLLFCLVLCFAQRWMETGRRKFLCAAFFFFGLLLTNNQELILLLPALAGIALLADPKLGRDVCLIAVPLILLATIPTGFGLWVDRFARLNMPLLAPLIAVALFAAVIAIKERGIASEWKSALLAGAACLGGLAFYFYLPITSATNPPVNWAYPRTLEGFLHAVSRGQFEHAQPTRDFRVFAQQLQLLLRLTGKDLGWPYFVFIALPFCFARRMNAGGRRWLGGLVAILVCTGPLLVALFNLPDDRQSAELLAIHLFPFYAVLAMLLGSGLIAAAARVARREPATLPTAPR